MAYALFAQKKLVLCGLLNSVQMQQTQRSDEQQRLATQSLSLKTRISNIQIAQNDELARQYEDLSKTTDSAARESINDKLEELELKYQNEIERMNNQVNRTSTIENLIEMEVKRLDTKVTALQKELESLQQAEGDAINKAVPQFKGIG